MRLVVVALGWTAGIILAANNNSGLTGFSLLWLALTGGALVAMWLAWSDSDRRWLHIALVAFTLGGLRMSFVPVSSDIARYNNSGGLSIEGIVVAEPDVRDTRTLLQVDAERLVRGGEMLATNGRVLVRAPRSAQTHVGDRVRATGLLIRPAEFDTFSYSDFLARSGVFSIMRDAAVEIIEPATSGWRLVLSNLKQQAAQHIGRALPEPQAGLLSGILLGDENGISPVVEDAFSRVGASHVIAISGFNMVILSGVIMNSLTRFRVPLRWAAGISIFVVLIYTVFVGANAAVVRAAIMSGLLVIGEAIKRKTYVPASLAMVAIVMSFQNPAVLWDVSFQLSFFATLGLALFVDPLAARFDALVNYFVPSSLARSLSAFLTEPLIVTLAVQITTLPLIVLYFNRLSLVTVVTNLLIVPVQAALLIIGIVATIVAFIIPAAAQILYWYDLILLSWTTEIVRILAGLSFADVEFAVDPRLIMIYFGILIGGALMHATQPTWAQRLARFVRRRAIANATAAAGVGMLFLVGASVFSRPDGFLHVWFLDVGHSNAVLAQTPDGAQMLVDGGVFPSRLLTALGDRLPFNDREIETLVITQPDPNEYGALSAVLSRYAVGVALTNGQPNLSPEFAALQTQLIGTDVVPALAGYTLQVADGVMLDVLHPQSEPNLDDSLDDQALVLRLSYGDVSFLLTGDISVSSQQALLDAGQWPLATVLQLPRHGTLRSLSERFLEAVQPQVALVQADIANQRGDPDPDTLNLLGDVPVYRTDEKGTIHFWTDGNHLWVQTETGT